jgi:radical SAM superfamily enzyme YgiQ (UPF0313 family)
MKVKLILPELARGAGASRVAGASSCPTRSRRRAKYSLWPPLGLATLAGYLRDEDEVTLQDENVEMLDLDDQPDLVGIQVYVSCANRAYEIADHYRRRGVHVALGGVHTTSMPAEAIRHADTIFLGPGEDTWPVFLEHFRAGRPLRAYRSTNRTLADQPPVRRDLIKRHLYLAPNSLVVSRGCPHACDFCSNSAFFRGGKSFYTQTVDQALAEIERLPGNHLYFLDDHIFGNRQFARALCDGLAGMGKIWQSAGTVEAALDREMIARAAQSGLRTLLVGFESLSADNMREQHKMQNTRASYNEAIRVLHDHGIMVNGSFVVGLDHDDESVFDRTVEWAISQGMETATFHILTPYPGTALYQRMAEAGRITTTDWDLYDTCHVVFEPALMSAEALLEGYHRAYRSFYGWSSIFRNAWARPGVREKLRHAVYAGGWGRCETLWHLVIQAQQVGRFTPLLEATLAGFGAHAPATSRPGAGFVNPALPTQASRSLRPDRLATTRGVLPSPQPLAPRP